MILAVQAAITLSIISNLDFGNFISPASAGTIQIVANGAGGTGTVTPTGVTP